MSRDINPFGLRMPPELKQELDREAKLNGRSLNAEIVDRLRRSLERKGQSAFVDYGRSPLKKGEESRPALTDIETQLLQVFRRMPPEKQLALLSLFK